MSDPHGDSSTADLDRAIALHKSGDLREAARIYQEVLDAEPGNSRVWAMLSQIWSSRLLFQRAADCLRRAIESEPEQFLYHFFLAAPLRRLHRFEDALAALDRAIALRPDHLDSHVERVAILEQLDRDASDARAALHGVLPGDLGELDRLAREAARTPSRRRLAIEIVRHALSLEPGSVSRLTLLGDLLRAAGQRESAADAYQRALEIDADAPGAAGALADLCERLGRLDDARWYAGLALQRSPDDPDLNLALARLDRREGRLREAATRLRALERSPAIDSRWTYAGILTELGWVLDGGGAYDEAFARFSAAQQVLAQRRAAQRHPIGGMRLWLDAVRERTPLLRASTWSRPAALAHRPLFLVSFFRASPSPLHRALHASGRFHVAADDALLGDILSSARAEFSIDEPYPDMLDRLSDEQVLELRRRYLAQASGDVAPDRPILDPHAMNIVRLPAIARLFPEARVVVDLDDPRDGVLNAFFEQLAPNPTSVHYSDLESAARLHAQIAGAYLAARALLDRAATDARVLEVRAASLEGDPAGELGRVLSFLGLPMSDDALRALSPSSSGAPMWGTTTRDEAIPLADHPAARWRNYARHIEAVGEILAPLIERFAG